MKGADECLLPHIIKNLWVLNTVSRIRLKWKDASSTLMRKLWNSLLLGAKNAQLQK